MEEALPTVCHRLKGFDMAEKLLKEQLKCLMLAKKVGLEDLEDDDVSSLLLSIGEELSVEDSEELEQQQRQLEEEVERESTPVEVSMKHLTVKNLQELFKRAPMATWMSSTVM